MKNKAILSTVKIDFIKPINLKKIKGGSGDKQQKAVLDFIKG